MMHCKVEFKTNHQILIYIAGLINLLLTGCAINHTGLVDVRQYENTTIRMISKEAWGVYLSTWKSDAGLVIGHVRRNFFYPKNETIEELPVTEILSRLHQDKFIESDIVDTSEKHDIEPVVWTTDDQGLMIHTNSYKMGLTLGIETRDVMRLPNDFNGVFVIRHNSQVDTKAYFQEKAPHVDDEQD